MANHKKRLLIDINHKQKYQISVPVLILVDIIVISQLVMTSNYLRSEISFIGGVIVVTGGILDCNSNRNSFKKE